MWDHHFYCLMYLYQFFYENWTKFILMSRLISLAFLLGNHENPYVSGLITWLVSPITASLSLTHSVHRNYHFTNPTEKYIKRSLKFKYIKYILKLTVVERKNCFFNNINVWDTEHVSQIFSLSALVYLLVLEMEMVFVGSYGV